MTTLSCVIGQTALALEDASEHGEVTRVAVSSGRINAVETDDHVTVPASAIVSFEGDMLTYRSAGLTTESLSDQSEFHWSKVLGLVALVETGEGLGEVADVDLTADGSITSLIMTNGPSIRGDRVLAAGSYAVIVSAE